MRFQVAGYSDKGGVKETNQDSFLLEVADTSLGDVALVAVADGMGGLKKGELASGTVVRKLSEWFEKKLPESLEIMESSIEGFQQSVEGQWAGFVQDLNLRIMRYGMKEGMGLGTTLTALLALGARYSFVHVGDSRIYEITDTTVRVLTTDQTFVQREIDAGRLKPEEAESHPQRNVLLQCVGSSKEVRPQVAHGNLRKDAVYLICSDGFRHELDNGDLIDSLSPSALSESVDAESGEEPQEVIPGAAVALERMVRSVIDRGERDNITAVLLRAVEGDR